MRALGYGEVSIRVVSDSTRLLSLEQVWNTMIKGCGKNPFFLSYFMKELMEFYRAKGWTPLVLIISVDNVMVGLAPLMTKRRFGVRFVKFLLKSSYSPDFVVRHHHREICLTHILDFLFKTLQCHFVDLTLEAESPSLRLLEQKCEANGIRFNIAPEMGHRILPVKCTWDEFKKSRGKKFRQEFRRIEKKLDQAGSWRIVRVENGDKESNLLGKILHVERMSWKEAWRTRKGMEIDEVLLMILKASRATARVESDFKWTVWFLELNDQTLSYTLVLQHKKAAFIQKASYDERFKRFYPGKYIINAAIRELFNERNVESIDFLTSLPFLRTWTSTYLPRFRVFLSQGGVLPTIAVSIFENVPLRKTLRIPYEALFRW